MAVGRTFEVCHRDRSWEYASYVAKPSLYIPERSAKTAHCSSISIHPSTTADSPTMSSNRSSRNSSPLRPGFGSAVSYVPDNMSVADDLHPVIHAGRVALITGAASGIGRAAAVEFAK